VFARQSIVTHAKAFQLDAIDLVDIDFKGWDGLRAGERWVGAGEWWGGVVGGGWG